MCSQKPKMSFMDYAFLKITFVNLVQMYAQCTFVHLWPENEGDPLE